MSTLSVANLVNITSINIANDFTIANTLSVGNSTVNTFITSSNVRIGSNTLTVGTAAYFVANGTLGIGTSNTVAARSLTLNNANNYYGIAFQVANVTIGHIFQEATGSMYFDAGSSASVNVGSLIFRTNQGEPRLTIDSGGKVGIGTTSPSFKLDVRGGRAQFSPASEAFAITLRYNDSTNGIWLGSPSANSFQISSAGGSPVFNIDGSGRVGIGTTSPSEVLDLGDPTAGRGICWSLNGTAQYSSIWAPYSAGGIVLASGYKANTSADGYLSSFNSASLYRNAIRLEAFGSSAGIRFFTDTPANSAVGIVLTPTERMRIQSNGNVGIGTEGATITPRLTIKGGSLPTGTSEYGLSFSSSLSATRLTTDSGPYTAFIGGYYDSGTLEISQGSSNNYVSGIVIGARTATNVTVTDAVALYTRSLKRMNVDGSGNVTLPYQPSFNAIGAGYNGPYFATSVVGNYIIHNQGGHYSAPASGGTGRFTAPVSGRYLFTAGVLWYGQTETAPRILYLRKNGSTAVNNYEDAASFNHTMTISAVIQLSAGDYVDAYCYYTADKFYDNGATSGQYGSSTYNFFSGQLLS